MAVDLTTPILVVDDYNTMVRIIRNLLRQLGFEHIDDANDGSEALEKMRPDAFALKAVLDGHCHFSAFVTSPDIGTDCNDRLAIA